MNQRNKLFVIYIGGTCQGALIELHDIRFIIAEKIEDTYEILQRSWWGTPESLHLDAWGALHWADGYSIEVSEVVKPEDTNNKLYFINLGGYDSRQFTELHRNVFVVAENSKDAKNRALKYAQDWESPHRDYQFEIDSVINVADFLNYKIKLTQQNTPTPFKFICKYVPIAKH